MTRNLKNPSHYFENTEMFIQMHPDKAPLAVLNNAIKRNGCPDEKIVEIANGAIAQELNRVVTPYENTVTVYQNGCEVPGNEPYNPTYEELICYTVFRFEGLESIQAKGIVDYLIHKNALTVYPDGKLYRTMVLVPRTPLSL